MIDVGLLQLGGEVRRDHFPGQERRSDVDPGVLVHLAPEELAPVGPLLADDLRPGGHRRIVDQQRAALAGDDVLRFVKTERTKVPQRPQRSAAMSRHDALRRVFDDQQAVTSCDLEDDIHGAADPGVVHWHDGTGPGRDRRFDQALVQIQGVGPHIDEDGDRAAEHERIGGRNEGVRGHDDLVARLDPGENCRHLQRGGARMSEQRLAAAGVPLQPQMTLPREWPIAGKVPVRLRLGDIGQFLARDVRSIEGNARSSMLRIIRAKNEHSQGTHRRVLLVVLPDPLKAGIRQVEGDVVELTTVHAEASAIALRENDGRWPALEVLHDHAPLVLPRHEPRRSRIAGSVTSSRRA